MVLQASAFIVLIVVFKKKTKHDKTNKTHEDQPIIWYVLNIRSLSVDYKGLWLLSSQCNLKNSEMPLTEHFWSTVEQ